MEEARLAGSIFITATAGLTLLGVRYLFLESQAKAYCRCGDEYNEHIVVPNGMINPAGSEKCKRCPCKEFKKNPKDPRNSPEVRFFPHPLK